MGPLAYSQLVRWTFSCYKFLSPKTTFPQTLFVILYVFLKLGALSNGGVIVPAILKALVIITCYLCHWMALMGAGQVLALWRHRSYALDAFLTLQDQCNGRKVSLHWPFREKVIAEVLNSQVFVTQEDLYPLNTATAPSDKCKTKSKLQHNTNH